VFGGLDVAIVVVRLEQREIAQAICRDRVERYIATRLTAATEIAKVGANRMGLTWTDGLVLHVLSVPVELSPAERTVARLVRAALAAETRRSADAIAIPGVRILAIAPDVDAQSDTADTDPMSEVLDGCAGDACDRDAWAVAHALGRYADIVAALAVHLAGSRSSTLSGLVLTPDACAAALFA
jgi:hypothetical protein